MANLKYFLMARGLLNYFCSQPCMVVELQNASLSSVLQRKDTDNFFFFFNKKFLSGQL